MKIIKIITVLTTVIGFYLLSGCATVKPYQKMYLNDEDMQLSNRKIETYETNFESFREGASGTNGGKVGGGCGCN